MTNLLDVTGLADPEPVMQTNLERLEEQVWSPTAPTRVSGTPTTVIGPPTSGTFAKDNKWTDANGALFVCTAAGSPGTWAQLRPALMAADPVAGTYPAGYRITRTDARGCERVCSVAGTPGTWVWQGLELAAIADLGGGATLADTIAKVNAILAAMRTARIILP